MPKLRLPQSIITAGTSGFIIGGVVMSISTIRGLQRYLIHHSYFSGRTVNSVIFAMGFHPQNEKEGQFEELSRMLKNCSIFGAASGVFGFTFLSQTVPFYKKHRLDIVKYIEETAVEFGRDEISIVQNFGVFRNTQKPTAGEIGKALWCNVYHQKLNNLYNALTWYALEQIAHTWRTYLEDQQALANKLSA